VAVPTAPSSRPATSYHERNTPIRRRLSPTSLHEVLFMAPTPTIPGWLSLWWTPTSARLLLRPLCSLRHPTRQPRGRGPILPHHTSPALSLALQSRLSPASEPLASKRLLVPYRPSRFSPGADPVAAATAPPRGASPAVMGPLAAERPSRRLLQRLCIATHFLTFRIVFFFV
jgi:hypothetical protein